MSGGVGCECGNRAWIILHLSRESFVFKATATYHLPE
jgi:hypothetical protein